MARITNVGMPKRKFVTSSKEDAEVDDTPEAGPSTIEEKPKRKVHRAGKRLKKKLERQRMIASGELVVEDDVNRQTQDLGKGGLGHDRFGGVGDVDVNKRKGAWGRDETIAKKAKMVNEKTEQRRLQRIDEKKATLTCFGCRETGHTARDCPKKGESSGNVCYRCNSPNHSLSDCRKPIDPSNPTPYATCYICSGSGHLSSQCSENSKGVYINGGKCKICESVRHRAGDCPVLEERRKAREEDENARLYDGRKAEVGPDEDDFMFESRDRIRDMRNKQLSKGKREKKPINNNSVRGLYVGKSETGGLEDKIVKANTAAIETQKAKSKVVAF